MSSIHVRIVGSPMVGKSTITSILVTRSAPKRQMPYSKTRSNQSFFATVRGPRGTSILMELLDCRGNETLDNLLAQESQIPSKEEEKITLLEKESMDSPNWCYLVVYDLTRHDTYLFAKDFVERLRRREAAGSSRGRRIPPASVIMIGNKREMTASMTMGTWTMEVLRFARERNIILFTGSALENTFSTVEKPERLDFVYRALELKEPSESDEIIFTLEQIFYLFKARSDMEYKRQPTRDEESLKYSETVDEDESQGNCCQRCCRRPKAKN